MLKNGILQRIRIAIMILFARKNGDIVFKVCGNCGSSRLEILHECTEDSKSSKELNDLCKGKKFDYIHIDACRCKKCGAMESTWEFWHFETERGNEND